MPLTSVLGAQSLIKPGVCTSSTRPASPYDGQVIYETDTNRTLVFNGSTWDVLGPGVFTSSTRPASPFEGQLIFETDTNRVVAYDGSNWVYAVDTDQPPGLQLVKTQTIGTAVSSVTVTDAFSADFDNYKIILVGGVGSGDTNFNWTLGSTTTGYYWAGFFINYSSTTVNGERAQNASNWNAAGRATTNNLQLDIEVYGPNLAKNTHYAARAAGAGTTQPFTSYAGYLADTTQYTAFTLSPNSGTITGGTIRVYGYRNS